VATFTRVTVLLTQGLRRLDPQDSTGWQIACGHGDEREPERDGQQGCGIHGGTYTLSRKVMFPNSLIHLLDVRFPGQTWVTGVLDPERIEAEIKSRLRANTPPAGTPVRNTWLGRLDVHRIGFTLSVGDVEDNVDALLLLTSSSLHGQPRAPLDPTYERELMRRRAIADATLPFRESAERPRADSCNCARP
jgi:hypothetical protein